MFYGNECWTENFKQAKTTIYDIRELSCMSGHLRKDILG